MGAHNDIRRPRQDEAEVKARWAPVVASYQRAGGSAPLLLPTMNTFERRIVHQIAGQCGLGHGSVAQAGGAKRIELRQAGGGSAGGSAVSVATTETPAPLEVRPGVEYVEIDGSILEGGGQVADADASLGTFVYYI